MQGYGCSLSQDRLHVPSQLRTVQRDPPHLAQRRLHAVERRLNVSRDRLHATAERLNVGQRRINARRPLFLPGPPRQREALLALLYPLGYIQAVIEVRQTAEFIQVVLLAGGDKRTQDGDIELALDLARTL